MSLRDMRWKMFQALLRQIATGTPVDPAALASDIGWPRWFVRVALWTARAMLERDETGGIVGAGLTQRKTEHGLVVDGVQLYTWCAVDALAFPTMLGADARVTTRCAATGAPIMFLTGPSGVRDASSPHLVMTIPAPDVTTRDLRSTFCARSNFFASREDASAWPKLEPGLEIESVADAHARSVAVIRRIVAPGAS